MPYKFISSAHINGESIVTCEHWGGTKQSVTFTEMIHTGVWANSTGRFKRIYVCTGFKLMFNIDFYYVVWKYTDYIYMIDKDVLFSTL